MRPYCLDLLLIGDQTDYSYAESLNFTSFVNPGKLKIVSLAVSNIIQVLDKSFQADVIN